MPMEGNFSARIVTAPPHTSLANLTEALCQHSRVYTGGFASTAVVAGCVSPTPCEHTPTLIAMSTKLCRVVVLRVVLV